MNEIRHLYAILSRPVYPASHHLRWSLWRRRHQARARHCTTSGDANERDCPPGVPARRPGDGQPEVDDFGMTVAEMITTPEHRAPAGPERHALVMPTGCECGMCAPTWARRRGKSRRHSEPVTLLTALRRENAAARPGMIEQHRTCLTAMLALVSDVIAAEPEDDLGTPELGLPLILFAGELAAAVQPDEFPGDLPASLIHDCQQTITTATLTAAGCLAGLVEAVQALSALTR